MANSNKLPEGVSLARLLAGQQTAYQQGRTRQNTQGTELVTAPEGAPAMTAQEVQNVVGANSAANRQAAQAAATAMPVTGMSVNGMGNAGRGQWYNAIGAGGKITDPAAFLAANPGAYNSPYAGAMQQLTNQLLNPEPFRYDVNADGLYQQIKDNYVKQGRQAMMDTQGQSAALTGGYGNSYGAMASQQAYQESLGNLAGMIPELQQLAYQQYRQGEDDKRNNLEALSKLDANEYARWEDEQKAYQAMLKTLPSLSHQTMMGGGGGPTIVLPGAAGAAGQVDPETLLALIGASDTFDRDTLKYLKNNNYKVNGVNQATMNAYADWLARQDKTGVTREVLAGSAPNYNKVVPNAQNAQTGGGYTYERDPRAGQTGGTGKNSNLNSEEYANFVSNWRKK